MKKFIKKYILTILFLVSTFITLNVSAMKSTKSQNVITPYEQVITTHDQNLPRSSSLTVIPNLYDDTQNNKIVHMHHGTQRNRLLKEGLNTLIALIMSLFK